MPIVWLKLPSLDALERLRLMPFVDYVEPAGLPGLSYASGCDWPSNDTSGEYDANGDWLPLSYSRSHVDRAWEYSNAAGAGVWIGETDTGVSVGLPGDFGINFNSGLSVNRSFLSTVTGGGSGISCSHGTRMAGIMAAPRNGSGAQGVAWKANLYSAKQDNTVAPVNATDAFQAIRDVANGGARVISLAWGTLYWSDAVSDEIDRLFSLPSGQDVVFVGAAGTSFAGSNQNNVIFPAEKSEVLAVSAADFNGVRDAQSHYGPELDVVAYQSTGTTGNASMSKLEHSSAATALVAGLAAIVRGRFPNESNVQVMNRIKSTAGVTCGTSTQFGPIVNAEAAIGGLCVYNGAPSGQSVVAFTSWGDPDPVYANYSVNVTGGVGPYLIQWSNGATGTSATYTWARGNYQYDVTATITDLGSGVSPLVVKRSVNVIDDCVDDPPYVDECTP